MSARDDDAYAVLEPYFLVARQIFVDYCEEKGLGKGVERTTFECREDIHDSPRHFAAASVDGRKIYAAPELADQSEDTVAAIFAHEFGHICDHRYPAHWVLVDEKLVFLGSVEPNDKRSEQARVARMRQWEKRDDHEVEVLADKIAEDATGSRIGYCGPCMLQGLNRGTPRSKDIR